MIIYLNHLIIFIVQNNYMDFTAGKSVCVKHFWEET